jgi:hypothetical protein
MMDGPLVFCTLRPALHRGVFLCCRPGVVPRPAAIPLLLALLGVLATLGGRDVKLLDHRAAQKALRLEAPARAAGAARCQEPATRPTITVPQLVSRICPSG